MSQMLLSPPLAWEYWQNETEPGFWPDLDMIPFGELQTLSLPPSGDEKPKERVAALCGKGWLGIFNRNPSRRGEKIRLSEARLKISRKAKRFDIWREKELGNLSSEPILELPATGVFFLEYTSADFH